MSDRDWRGRVGGVEIKFIDRGHKYFVRNGDDWRRAPSITECTGLMPKWRGMVWSAVNEARDYLLKNVEPGRAYDELEIEEIANAARLAHQSSWSRAGTVGSIVHDWIESRMKAQLGTGEEKPLPVHEQARAGCEAWLAFEEENDVEPIWSERIMYLSDVDVAGRADLAAYVNGVPSILEVKTSKAIYDAHHIQVSWQLAAARACDPDHDWLDRRIVHCDKNTGEVEVVEPPKALEEDLRQLEALRQTWEYQQGETT